MSTMNALLVVVSSSFVCGFCLDLGLPFIDAQDSLMNTLRDHAQRQLFRRFDQQKQLRNADPPLSNFVHLTEVRSSGANETGDVTLEASFLQAADFTWLFFNNGNATFTTGRHYKSGIRITTSFDVNVNDNNFNIVMLFLYTKSFSVFIYFDRANITQAGVQSVTNHFVSFDVPKTANVEDNGDITFDITLPSNYTDVTQHLDIFYAYINPVTQEFEQLIQTFEPSAVPGTQNTRITIRDSAKNAGGYLTLYINDIDKLDTDSNTSLTSLTVIKTVDVGENGAAFTNDVVSFGNEITPPSSYHVPGDDHIRYGSVPCSAYGHPKPTVTIWKEDQALNSIKFAENKLSTAVYVQLDGKTKAEAAGVYYCLATSGSKTIFKPIAVG